MLSRVGPKRLRVRADARMLPFGDASFDLVNASLIAGDMCDLSGWIAEVARVLAPNGHLIYSDFHPRWIAEGWQRTFALPGGGTGALPFVPHAIEAHRAAVTRARLSLTTLTELQLPAETNAGSDTGRAAALVLVHARRARAQ